MKRKKLKDYYDTACARLIAEKISEQYSGFNQPEFVAKVSKGIRGREFLARQDLFAEELEEFLPNDYGKALKILTRVLGPELQQSSGMFIHGWWLWPIGRYVQRNALIDSELSLQFIYELTKRFTGEFAIRPLLECDPTKTLKTVRKWSKDDNVHVRRLASEGIRVRLPWAKKLSVFLDYPEQCSLVLSNLRQDSEKFVQKSVGNNINDLMKENQQLAKSIIASWQQDQVLPPATAWIIKHGLRSERKGKV